MRIKFLCIIICLFVNALVFASATNHTITGVVISGEDNEPLIGASVYVHADDLKKAGVSQTSLGTITDIDGKFSISVPEKVTRIHCSHIGFEEQAIILQGNKKKLPYCTTTFGTYSGGCGSNGIPDIRTSKINGSYCKGRII